MHIDSSACDFHDCYEIAVGSEIFRPAGHHRPLKTLEARRTNLYPVSNFPPLASVLSGGIISQKEAPATHVRIGNRGGSGGVICTRFGGVISQNETPTSHVHIVNRGRSGGVIYTRFRHYNVKRHKERK